MVTPLAVAVAAALSTIVVALVTEAIVAPAGIPVPVTNEPTSALVNAAVAGVTVVELVPLEAQSVIMSLPGVNSFQTDHPTHIPCMTEPVVYSTVWSAPNGLVAELEGGTGELVLMGRSLKALKVMVRISNESMRSSEALTTSQLTIVNLLRNRSTPHCSRATPPRT